LVSENNVLVHNAGSKKCPLKFSFKSNKSNAGVGGKVKNTYSPIEYNGTVKVNNKVRDVSRKIYQRSDIDWNYVDPDTGLTNLQRAAKGRPPIGPDGKPVELHHLIQQESGPMVEILQSTHDQYAKALHGLVEDGASFRNNPILDKQYNNFRKGYWKWRSKQITEGGNR